MSRQKDQFITASFVIALFLLLLFSVSVLFHPLQQDEGVFLAIGRGIAHGSLPYRDFFDHKPPGIYFLFATLYRLLGGNIIWYKIVLILANLASAWLVYRVAIRLSSITRQIPNSKIQNIYKTVIPAKAGIQDKNYGSQIKSGMTNSETNVIINQLNNCLFAPIFFLWLLLIFQGQYLIAEPFMTTLLVFAVFLIIGQYISAEKTKKIPLFAAGFFLGLAILFKQTAIISIAAIFLWLIWRKQWSRLLPITIGFIVPLASLAWYFSFNNLWPDAWAQIVTYNFKYYPAENFYKVLGLLVAPFLYTLPVWILFVLGTIKFKRHIAIPQREILVLISLLAVIPMFSYFGRHYPHYWLQSAPFIALVAAWGLDQELRIKNKVPVTTIFILLSASLFTYNYLSTNFPKYLDEKKLVQFIQRENRPIYAENQFTGIYFLTGAKPSAKYLYITEISDWSEQSEHKTIEQLLYDNNFCHPRENGDPLIVDSRLRGNDNKTECTGGYALIVWPADSNYAYAKDLQQYIFANYEPKFWQHELGAVIYEPQMDDKSDQITNNK